MEPNKIKLFGLQRTGTNYLKWLLENNLDNVTILEHELGWKHSHFAHYFTDEEYPIVIIAKHPLSWLVSVWQYWSQDPIGRQLGPDLSNKTFEQFLKEPLIAEMQRGVPFLNMAKNPIWYFQNMYLHWTSIRLQKHPVLLVNYEHLLDDVNMSLYRIATELKIPLNKEIKIPQSTFRPDKSNGGEWNKQQYYVNREYLKEYSTELLDYVNGELEESMMELLRYQREKHWLYYFNTAAAELKKGNFESFDHWQDLAIKDGVTQDLVNHNNGLKQRYLGNIKGAEELYYKALDVNPDLECSKNNLALTLAVQGNWKDGLKLWESRFKVNPTYQLLRDRFNCESWDWSKDLTGKHIIVYNEQGRGDLINFVRFIQKLKELGAAKITLEAREEILDLYRNCDYIDYFIERLPQPIGNWDYKVSVNTLLGLFEVTPETVPNDVPYLFPKEQDVKQLDGDFKIGFCWGGSTEHGNDKVRSVKNHYFSKFNLPNVKMYSLQVGREDLITQDDFYEQLEIKDFNELANYLKQLDLIISVDTSVIHLAGAMDIPVWMMLHNHRTDFRWLLGKDTSVWYPSLKIFRQDKSENWETLFNETREALIDYIKVWQQEA